MAGIYIHIPFCKQACHYCDFHFSTNQKNQHEIVAAIAKEIALQKNYLNGEVIQTIYFGGGTPSLLSEGELSVLMEAIHLHHRVIPEPEVTVEANPDDLTPEKLLTMVNLGINRLSIGIQSFHPEFLTYLNRSHTATTAIASFQNARTAGFKNISIDLIYAIPGETQVQWKKDIEQALALQPDHISSYSLTIEDKTVFGRWSAAGKLKATDEDVAASQLEILINELESHGFEHYEISNFARSGYYSRHNSSYWKETKYLGVGPSAHSYNGESRQHNVRNNHVYLKSLNDGSIPFEKEILSRENKINEYILTSLRTQWGADLGVLKNKFGYDLLTSHQDYLSQISGNDLAILEDHVLRLTKKGKLLADKIASDLFAAEI